MKRAKIELWSVGFALAMTALAWPTTSSLKTAASLSVAQARAEAANYLDHAPRFARLDVRAGCWRVSDGHDTARLDARTGELLEIEFDSEP